MIGSLAHLLPFAVQSDTKQYWSFNHAGIYLAPGSQRICPTQQVGCLNAQFLRQAIDHIYAGGIDATLQSADVCAVDLRAMGEFFLRQASGLTEFAQIGGKYLPDLHDPEKPRLMSI